MLLFSTSHLGWGGGRRGGKRECIASSLLALKTAQDVAGRAEQDIEKRGEGRFCKREGGKKEKKKIRAHRKGRCLLKSEMKFKRAETMISECLCCLWNEKDIQ